MTRQNPSLARRVMPALPAAVVLAALAWAPWSQAGLPPADAAQWWMMPLLAAIAAAASLLAPWGMWTLGLGAMAIPPALVLFSPSIAAWVAVSGCVFSVIVRWIWMERRDLARRPRVEDLMAATGRIALAVLVAGVVWHALWAGSSVTLNLAATTAVAGVVYLLVMTVLLLGELWVASSLSGRVFLRRWTPLGLDAAGWILGTAAAQVIVMLWWSVGLLPLVAVSMLAADAARSRTLRKRAVRKVRDLWGVTRAGYRISVSGSALGEIATQVLSECRRVVPLEWFEFTVAKSGGESEGWWAGPDGQVKEGEPQPSAHPPVLIGFHRRVAWRILERPLTSDGEVVAGLRLWCDPRRLDETSVELLDSLLPQIASAVHRALLDRRANLDDLTGLGDRGAFEQRVAASYQRCCDEGGRLAVVLCDLDRFKRINDRLGHQAGDRALVHFARVLEEHRREGDLCSRYGGEEFVVVVEGADSATALAVAERLRIAVQRSELIIDGKRIKLRMSAGVGAFPELFAKNAGELVELADEALYEAKRLGRNRVLLNMGRGRYLSPDGDLKANDQPRLEMRPPTLFA